MAHSSHTAYHTQKWTLQHLHTKQLQLSKWERLWWGAFCTQSNTHTHTNTNMHSLNGSSLSPSCHSSEPPAESSMMNATLKPISIVGCVAAQHQHRHFPLELTASEWCQMATELHPCWSLPLRVFMVRSHYRLVISPQRYHDIRSQEAQVFFSL